MIWFETDNLMEPDEIRAEIERRRKRAIDLKLRETLWTLYYWHLRSYAENLKKDPEMIYPEVRETLEISDAHIQFHVHEITYTVMFKEGPVECESRWRGRSIYDETRTTPVTLALKIDEKRVFDFEVKKTVTDTPDGPLFDEFMGNVTSFIEGPWVTDVAELLQKIKAHEKNVRDKRQAPELQKKLREDMKRFGL
jgi:hypothetical protein